MVSRTRTIYQSPLSRTEPIRADQSDKLPELLLEADVPLSVISSVFPFDFFPDTLVIRINHIDLIHRIFFFSATQTRMQINTIRQVEVQHNLFFATIVIYPLGPVEHIIEIPFLWVADAMKARRILSGLVEAHQNKVDFSTYTTADLIPAMETLGKARE